MAHVILFQTFHSEWHNNVQVMRNKFFLSIIETTVDVIFRESVLVTSQGASSYGSAKIHITRK
jgi:hypothetical protein